jgi:Maltokinase N-terminal cap domain
VARQPWFRGRGVPSLTPIGYFRLEDPSGEVGIETHLVTDGLALYQVPMTYRGAPMKDGGPAGQVMGTWHPGGPGTPAVTGCLAVVRAVTSERAETG